MRFLTILAALTLVALASPVTADGVDVSVRYLDEASSCTTTHSYADYGNRHNDSYWYWSSEKHSSACSDEFTYASASAATDNETLVAASADGQEWSRGNSSRSDSASGWWYDGYSGSSRWRHVTDANAEGWSRDVTVETMAGDAQASRGCSTAHAYTAERSTHESTSYKGNETYRSASSDESRTYDYSEECHESVTAGDATVARRDECTFHDESRGYGSQREYSGRTYEYGYESHRGENACFSGVTADAAGEQARVGTGGVCSYESAGSVREGPDGRTSWTHEQSDCRNGVIANGPLGASAFAGLRDGQWQSCEGEGNASRCEEDAYRSGGADAQWERSPAGPISLWFYRSLP